MKKYIVLLVISVVLLLSNISVHGDDKQASLIVDGKLQSSTIQVIKTEESVLVPIGEVLKPFGAVVYEDKNKGAYTLVCGDVAVLFNNNSKTVQVNSKKIQLKAPVLYKSGKIMASTELLNEITDIMLEWSNDFGMLTVISNPNRVVSFNDKKLEAAVRNCISKPTGEILKKDLKGIRKLNAQSSEIVSLEGLQYFFDLEELMIYYNQITDISQLSNLTNLKKLYASDNQITDIRPIKGLVKLTNLRLSSNKINDISITGSFSNLEDLSLGNNNISDISCLSNLIKLRKLSLTNNPIGSITPLKGLTGLRDLALSGCRLNGEIDALVNMPGMLNLWLSDNNITDINALKGMKNLNYLDISKNSIVDISALKDAVKLTRIDMAENQIKDIGALAGFTKLRTLDLDFNRIDDISALKNIRSLEYIDLFHNEVRDISALSGLTSLFSLSLSENYICDISPLRPLTNLVGVSVCENQIKDISVFMYLPKLVSLHIGINPIEDISPIDYLSKIDEFKIYYVDTVEKAKEVHKEVTRIIDTVIKPGMSDYEKELAIHDYLVKHVTYDYKNYINNTLPKDYGNPYGLLINGKGVCGTYAFTMKLLLNKAGIECMYVSGKVDSGEGHAWNIVKIEGEYYHVDATWDDPVKDDINDDTVRHTYFNLTDEQIGRNHTWNKDEYPQCSSEKYNYINK